MDLMSVCVIAAVLAVLVVVLWQSGRTAELQAKTNVEIVDKLMTYRGTKSPESHAVEVLSTALENHAEKLLVFSAEGRDILKERERTREIIEGLRGEVKIQRTLLENLGVRPRPSEPGQLPQRPEPEIVEAEFARHTDREI